MDIPSSQSATQSNFSIEVTLSEIAKSFIVVKTPEGEEIKLPRFPIEKTFMTGDMFLLELKKNDSSSLETLVKNAHQNKSHENEERMRKLLEELIN